MKFSKHKIPVLLLLLTLFFQDARAQVEMPTPGTPKSVAIPAVKETRLSNGLTVAVVERKNVPLVSVQLLLKSGANLEPKDRAGLANLTFSLLTKGTAKRSATDIANEIEFLGGSIYSGANWNSASVSINVMSDKLDRALQIMSDVALNPAFKQEEVGLLKTQTLDNLTYNLSQPGFVASYLASALSFKEHPAGGTPASIAMITREDIVKFYQASASPNNGVLIFTGDITQAEAVALSKKYISNWKAASAATPKSEMAAKPDSKPANAQVQRLVVIDMPASGQAAVMYLKKLDAGRVNRNAKSSSEYYASDVLNSVLGGGYSSRLNQEIRMKRGLSYGARSGFSWRSDSSNFSASTQTKNESAAEVVHLILEELNKLSTGTIETAELSPRKLVLAGDFSRDLETNNGLARAVAELYSFQLPASELNSYMTALQGISSADIVSFAKSNLPGGDIVIVGDYAIFKDDLAKRFPALKPVVIQAKDLDLSKI